MKTLTKNQRKTLQNFLFTWRNYLNILKVDGQMNILESYVSNIIMKIRNMFYILSSVGDVVIIHEDILKLCDWRIGKIVELVKSKDGKIRSAKVDVISKDKNCDIKEN